MLKSVVVVLVCLYLIRDATAAVSCSTDSNCSYGGATCQCKCCLIGLNLNLLGGTLTTTLCLNILGGTVVCCDTSGPTPQQCTNHTSPPITTTTTTTTVPPPTEAPTLPPTTTTTTTTQPPPPTTPATCQDPSRACPRTSCLDLYSECAGWAQLGYCTLNPERAASMEKNCPVSCGYCSEICVDYECPDVCASRAAAGDCLTDPEFMLVRCKASCKYCDRCTNLHTACPYLVSNCTSTDPDAATSMHFYCRATCNDCVQTSDCSILDPVSQKCPRDWNYSPLTNLCYWGTLTIGLRQDVQAQCAANDGNLISIHSLEQNLYFSSVLPTPSGFAIFYFHGLFRTGGDWATNGQWQDGSVVNYTNWLPGQPSGTANELNAGIHLPDGFWSDFLTTDQYPGFCEKETCPISTTVEPTTTAP